MTFMDDVHGGHRQPIFSDEESDTGNEISALYREDFGEKYYQPHMIRWKSGKRIDPRLLTLLESFREIYVKRQEFFMKIFPTSHEDFVAVFKKTGNASMKKKETKSFRTLGRSLSLGSKRPERFKVRTPKVVVVAGGDQGDKAATNSKNSLDEVLKWID